MQRLSSLLCYIRIYTCGSNVGFVGHVSCVFVFVVFFKFAVVSINVFHITIEQVQSLTSLFAKTRQGEFDKCLQNSFFQCLFFCLLLFYHSVSQSVTQLYFRHFSADELKQLQSVSFDQMFRKKTSRPSGTIVRTLGKILIASSSAEVFFLLLCYEYTRLFNIIHTHMKFVCQRIGLCILFVIIIIIIAAKITLTV